MDNGFLISNWGNVNGGIASLSMVDNGIERIKNPRLCLK